MDEALRRRDDEMVDDLEKRFDKHLEIYANNGKEMAKMGVLVEQMLERDKVRDKKVDEMYTTYQEFMLGKKGIIWAVAGIFALFMALGSAYLMAKNIMK